VAVLGSLGSVVVGLDVGGNDEEEEDMEEMRKGNWVAVGDVDRG
jgi:hypothetical protein